MDCSESMCMARWPPGHFVLTWDNASSLSTRIQLLMSAGATGWSICATEGIDWVLRSGDLRMAQ